MVLTPEQASLLAMAVLEDDEAAPVLHEVDDAVPEFPERIGRYRVTGVIAEGGMGTVYEGEQSSPARRVAIKVLKPSLLNRLAIRRFRYESEVLANLRHPCIAQVYEAGTHDTGGGGVPYYVMELIPEAETITQFAIRKRLTHREKLGLFVDVCDAVHHGHLKGFIHRDLKPSNILVEGESTIEAKQGVDASGSRAQPKIIDFGIARATDSDVAITTMQTDVRQLLGTLQYMSPEQCDGDPNEIDQRSDVYSLGVVLYELLTGQLPYDVSGSTITHAARVIHEVEPAKLRGRAARHNLERDLEAIVLKALAKRSGDRYQSVAELAADIRRFLKGESTEARPPSRWMKAVRWAARHPMAFSSMTAVFILVSSILISYFFVRWFNNQPHRFEFRSADNRTVYYESRSGNVLDWLGGTPHSQVHVAILENLPPHLGGDKVALISVSGGHHNTHAQLFMTRPDDLENPLLRTYGDEEYIAVPDIPLHIGETPKQLYDFSVTEMIVADVFPSQPGNELIAAHASQGAALYALRVYDFELNVLFEAWYVGVFKSFIWHAETGQIICGGDRHGLNDISRYGFGTKRWPKSVFALKPKLNAVTGWINEHDEPHMKDFVAWYKVLNIPPHLTQYGNPEVSHYKSERQGDHYIHVLVLNNEASATIVLDPQGTQRSFGAHDSWDHSKLGSVEFVDWPPTE